MKIHNMKSPNTGCSVANQFIVVDVPAGIKNAEGIEIGAGDMLQSYSSIIAFREYSGRVFLDAHYWDFSQTTGRYRNQFLGEDIRQTRKKIESGEYTLVHFN